MARAFRKFLVLLALLVACVAASRAFAQSCDMYSTDFGSFAGPPDLTDGELRVLWCENGASVTGSNFCPTGNALRLDAASEDPVVLIATGTLGCSAIEISFKYAQFAASGTVVKYGLTNATAVSCTASTTLTLGALTTTSGACTTFSATIPLGSSKGVYLRLDHGANTNAITIDDFVIRRVGCCNTSGHSCCVAGSAGCVDAAVQSCVCAQDPYCCATEWDAQCVTEVTQFGCGACGDGGGGGACATTLAIDFGTLFSGGSICTKFPAVFERCEGTPPFLTSSLGCTGSGDMAMRFSQGFPYSAAITKCVSLASLTTPGLAFSFSKETGTLGPRIDVSLDGISWTQAWTAPITYAGGCTALILDLSPLAGETSVQFRFSSGSSIASLATFDDIALVEIASPPHGCCETGGPSCTDAATASCTCALDAFCCETEWDLLCTAIATSYCGAACPDLPVCGSPTAGNCRAAHATPACEDAACCLSVCAVDTFCCDEQWDSVCVAQAQTLCGVNADVDGDGVVGPIDLATVLARWGDTGSTADVDGDGVVGAGDLAAVLSAWSV